MDKFLYGCIYLSAAIAVSVLLMIICYVTVRGIGSVSLEFLTTVTSARKGTVGIAGNIVNTLYIIVITLVIATPIGVGSAIYLNEYAKPGKIVRVYNLLTNSMRAVSRDGTGKICLSVSSDGGMTTFCVSDNGKGMNEEERQRRFSY